MVSFTSIFTAAVAVTGTLAAPVTDLATRSLGALTARAGTPSSAGTHNGCYYSWWTDGGAQATYTNGNGGSYSVSWQTGGNLVGGKGWNPGAARYVKQRNAARKCTNSLFGQHHYLLRHLQPLRQFIPRCLWLDPQPSDRILRRRELWHI